MAEIVTTLSDFDSDYSDVTG